MTRKIQLAILMAFLNVSCTQQLRPFVSDGFSVFPDGAIRQSTLWLKCCIAHDLDYWKGGSYEERAS